MPPTWFRFTSDSKRRGQAGWRQARPSRSNGCRRLRLESLEIRSLLSVSVLGEAVPDYVAPVAQNGAVPLSTAAPTGYSPAQIRHAYGIDQITFNNGTVAGNGAGTTIAIVDAYDDPRIANDLHQFDLRYGLPDPVFTKVNENGGTSYPAANAGWITEIALDVEWAHAIAPLANILLVEASSASFNDLLTAVNYARNAVGVVAVSMSWGGGDFSGEQSYDGYFTTPSGHGGVTFVASSGDSGAPVGYPAISPNVVSVGGTTLSLGAGGAYGSESGWSGSGGGLSAYEAEPSYQRALVTQTSTFRANPDVSYDANPNTGFSVYDSYNNPLSAPWAQWGGTSDAAPQWAALVAIADQGRMLAGKGSLDGATQTLPMLYSLSSADFHDITSGTSTGSPRYSAAPGYDLVTGRGSPVANLMVADLVGAVSTPPANATPPAVFGIVVTEATPQNGILESNEQGVITWAVTESSPITVTSLAVDGTLISATNGPYGPYAGGTYFYSGVFGPLTAGTHSYRIQMTDANGLTGTATGSFVVAPAAAPVISGVVVAEATPQNGILESNEQGVVTWAVTGSSPITGKSLTVDGAPASATYGPYGPNAGGAYYYSGIFGPLAAGMHNYQIQVTDADGLTATATGSFVVAPAAAPVIYGIVVAEASGQNGVLTSNEQGVVTWAVSGSSPIATKSLTVDGAPASATYGPYGPYAGGVYYCSGVFGPLAAGSHDYVIQVTDTTGATASYSGNFTVSSPLLTRALAALQAPPALPAMVAGTLRPPAIAAGTPPAPDGQWVGQTEDTVASVQSAAAAFPPAGTAGEPEFPQIVRLRALAAANGLTAAQRVELLDALVGELKFAGDFAS